MPVVVVNSLRKSGHATDEPMSNPHAETLARAVHAVFGEWTALKLAVENEWAGDKTRERALALLQRVRDGLLSSPVLHRDEIEVMLDEALMDEFNVEAEDDSPAQVAQLLCQLHAEAKAGVSTTATALLLRASKKGGSTWVEVPPPPRVKGDDDESSDDECEDDDSESATPRGGGATAMDEDDGTSARAEPEVDEGARAYTAQTATSLSPLHMRATQRAHGCRDCHFKARVQLHCHCVRLSLTRVCAFARAWCVCAHRWLPNGDALQGPRQEMRKRPERRVRWRFEGSSSRWRAREASGACGRGRERGRGRDDYRVWDEMWPT